MLKKRAFVPTILKIWLICFIFVMFFKSFLIFILPKICLLFLIWYWGMLHHVLVLAPSAPPMPVIPDRASKPSATSSSSLYSSSGLRNLIVPESVMSKFLTIAKSNTDASVETCAILAGVMQRDQFTITHVIVPKQTGKWKHSCVLILILAQVFWIAHPYTFVSFGEWNCHNFRYYLKIFCE